MTVAFVKLLHCIVLIRACLFARGRFIYYWMKWCFLPSILSNCCIDTRFSKCSSQEFAGFTVCKKFSSLLYYLSISIFIYPSIYFKIVWPQVSCRSRRCHRYKEIKGTFKSQIFVSGDLEIFPKKSSHRQIILISIKAFKRYVAHFLKCCPLMKVCSWTKTVITTELFSFLSVEKNSPFSLNFVYGPQSSHRDQW